MKKTAASALALTLLLPILSSVSADEKEELRKECEEVGRQHGIEADRMEDWVARCIDNIRELQKRREQQQQDGADSRGREDQRER